MRRTLFVVALLIALVPIAGQSASAGKITDIATATAVLGNWKGNASANAASLTGLAKVDAAALTGNDAFNGTATTLTDAAPVVSPAGPGPVPVGGVQTGASRTSHRRNWMVPIGTTLGSAAVGAALGFRRRRP